jgi:hypothetical protein
VAGHPYPELSRRSITVTTTVALPPPTLAAPPTVEIDVQLQPLDLYRANRATVWRQVRWICAIGAAIVLLRALSGDGLLLLGVVGIIGLFSFVIHSGFLYMAAKSALRSNRVLSSPIHYSLTPSGLEMSSPTFWNRQSWSNLYELLETRQLIILRSSSAQKYVIPKSRLAPGDLEKVRALARSGLLHNEEANFGRTVPNSSHLTANVQLAAEELYRGLLILLLRKSYWYAGQLAFSFALIFVLNPRFLSPTTFVAVGALFFFYFAAHLYWSSARAIRTNAAYKNGVEYAFGESGLDGVGSTFSFHHDWCNFRSIIEDSKLFLFCPSNSQVIVVPKRSFANPSQIQKLRDILKNNYTGKLSLKH